MRKCKKCFLVKPLEEFPLHNCGRRHACRECYNASRLAKIKSNPERLARERAAKDLWRKNNPEKAKIAISNWAAKNRPRQTAKCAKRRAKKKLATLKWLSDIHMQQINWFYAAAKMMTETTGIKHEVDHIHPIQGENFTGLHVPWNLRCIPKFDNRSKGNKLLLT